MPNVPLPPRNPDDSYTTSLAGMAIDADGANGQTGGVPVYAPKGYTPAPLDFLANAGGPGNWFGVVTDTNRPDGRPVKQKDGDPAPGAFVSATSYRWPERARIDPLAYVDAASVPYIVLPSPGARRPWALSSAAWPPSKIQKQAGFWTLLESWTSAQGPSSARHP